MRVRTNIQALPGQKLARPRLVEEDEGPDHLALARRQGAANLEAADVMDTRQEHRFHAVRRCGGGGRIGGLPAHHVLSLRIRWMRGRFCPTVNVAPPGKAHNHRDRRCRTLPARRIAGNVAQHHATASDHK